ncbi:uncharacterized protein LOC103701709 [Phoenix dactylifera]|uniref:Uncharacterized protein LOC103701709 n=1 Tax=Phoenix dactylifera TaxID=42345 RepID=A0A8B9AN11_PHODC|nr:uncharacterized protein LOC103701709 [Phoenix dactylifera]
MGLRQGCPLSPYLFIICSDVLSYALHIACEDQGLAAYSLAPGACPISYLLFADNCLLLARARARDARAFQRVLAEYCAASRQRINFQKSSMHFNPSTERRVRREIRALLGMQEQEGALDYLGVPITGRRLRVAECSTLVQRVQSRLKGWRASSLSMMGRLTLVRSVLCSMPVYIMAHTVVPKMVLVGIERLMRSFLWGSLGRGHGMHLVAWERVCLPLSEGGLGVQSLLARRAVQIVLEPHGHWSQIMIARYGRAGLVGQVVGSRRSSFMWREVGRYLPMARAHSRWLIGDGQTIDVMKDPWVDALPLSLWPTMISGEGAVGLRICDLLVPGVMEWDDDRLGQLFGEHLAERVRALSVPGSAGPDVRVWSTTCRARVRVGDVSRVLQQESELGRDCGWVEESVDHALFQYVWARTWRLSGLSEGTWSQRDSFLEVVRRWSSSPQMRFAAIRASCIAYQVWMAKNVRVFGKTSLSPRFVMERARAQAAEFFHADTDYGPLTAWDTWGPHPASAASHMVFFTWDPQPPSFLKINFDGSIQDGGRRGGAGFVMKGLDSSTVAAEGCQIFDISIPGAELRATWMGLWYARFVFRASSILLKGDSATVISWVRKGPPSDGGVHFLLRDIWLMVREGVLFRAMHVYREANGAMDWVAAYVASHSGDTL